MQPMHTYQKINKKIITTTTTLEKKNFGEDNEITTKIVKNIKIKTRKKEENELMDMWKKWVENIRKKEEENIPLNCINTNKIVKK